MLANGTIIDIYRKAQDFAKDSVANKNSIQQAVNVARLLHPLPDISLSDIGTAKLTWIKGNITLSFEFFNFSVNVVFAAKGVTDQTFTGVQYHSGSIPVNVLFAILQQFCLMTNTPAPKINPWDEFEDIYFENINIDDIKEREEAATENKVKTFLSFKKTKTDIQNDNTTAEKESDIITEEEDSNQESQQ